jgi:hypothetical protein
VIQTDGGAVKRRRPTKAEIAWAAGLWAGEGTAHRKTGANAAGTGRKLVGHAAALVMNDEWEVREFGRIVGLGTIRVCNPPQRQNNGYAPGWAWQVQNRAGVQRVYDLLGPFLSDRRCVQFETALV